MAYGPSRQSKLWAVAGIVLIFLLLLFAGIAATAYVFGA